MKELVKTKFKFNKKNNQNPKTASLKKKVSTKTEKSS